jgi:hypothetical protein
MSTDFSQPRPRPVHEVTLTTNSDGLYYDGHGEPSYVEDKEALAFHHVAVANGWELTTDRTPYENLKAALEATSEYRRQRDMIIAFAFAYVRGLGPKSARRALARMEDVPDVRTPADAGGDGE